MCRCLLLFAMTIGVVSLSMSGESGFPLVEARKKKKSAVLQQRLFVPYDHFPRIDPDEASIVLHRRVPVPVWDVSYRSIGKPTKFSAVGGVSLYNDAVSGGRGGGGPNATGELLLFPSMSTQPREDDRKECSHMVHAVERHSGKWRYSIDILQFAKDDAAEVDDDGEHRPRRKTKHGASHKGGAFAGAASASSAQHVDAIFHDCTHPYNYAQFLDAVMQ
jgi:hypothetical protein